MTDRTFPYDDHLLHSCATSTVAQFIVQSDTDPPNHYDHQKHVFDESHDDTIIDHTSIDTTMLDDHQNHFCELLFGMYMEHYNRRHSDPYKHITRNTKVSHRGNITYRIGSSMKNFIRNVSTIHRHNSQPKGRWHQLRLNQFSDQDLQQIFPPTKYNEPATTTNDRNSITIPSHMNDKPPKTRRLHQASSDALHRSIESMKVPLVHLSSFDDIETFGMERFYHENAVVDGRHDGFVKQQINQYTKHKSDHIQFALYPSKLRLPTDDMISTNDQDDDQNKNSPTDTIQFYKSVDKKDMDGSLVYIGRNKKQSFAQKEHDIFAASINWATTNNPDGVPIVNDPIDQVTTTNENPI
jgi:hypothetical protein